MHSSRTCPQLGSRTGADGVVQRGLSGTCERAGLEIVAIHTKKWSVSFRGKWRSEFALPEVDWEAVGQEWEILGTELAPARHGRAAIRQFNETRSEAETSFLAESLNFAEVYEVHGTLPDHAWLRREVGPTDLYVVEGEWRWSFVMTHEEAELRIGPFCVCRLESE